VASPVATTAGMPYSRATSEAWAARVPPSVTTAAARANSGVQAGGGGPGDQDLAGLKAVVDPTAHRLRAAIGAKREYWPWNVTVTVSVGPLRCLARIRSASPFRGDSGSYSSSR